VMVQYHGLTGETTPGWPRSGHELLRRVERKFSC
jgi:hypothetical protein